MKFKVGNHVVEVKDDEIVKAIEEKKEELTVTTDLIVRNAEEETTYKENVRAEAKKTGVEEAIKEARKTYGLEFEGKTVEKFFEAAKKKGEEEAKVQPDEKVSKLEKKVEELKNANLNLEEKAKNAEKEKSDYISGAEINEEIDKHIPENSLLPKEEMRILIKSKLSFEKDENGKVIVKDKDGNVIKNKTTADALPVEKVFEDFFRDNPKYVQGAGGGAGGGDSKGGGGGKQTLEDFIKEQKEGGVSPGSEAFEKALAAKQEAKEIDMGDSKND